MVVRSVSAASAEELPARSSTLPFSSAQARRGVSQWARSRELSKARDPLLGREVGIPEGERSPGFRRHSGDTFAVRVGLCSPIRSASS